MALPRRMTPPRERETLMAKLVLIGLGGCLGAIARYSLAGLAQRWTSGVFPVGTLLVNVLGCFAIGAVMGLVEGPHALGPNIRFLFVIGFLGSFTTLSTLGYETVEMLRDGQFVWAALNACGNMALGLGAVILGRLAARAAAAIGGFA